MSAERRYRLKDGDTPASLALAGKGDSHELWRANHKWMSSDHKPWNAGQQVVIPAAWQPLDGEFLHEE